MPPPSQGGAIRIIEIPDCEPTQEDAQAERNHDPHLGNNDLIPDIFPLLFQFLLLAEHVRVSKPFMHYMSPAEVRPQVQLHDVHTPQQHKRGQDGVGVLVEGRVLQVVVVGRDEDGQGDGEEAEQERDRVGAGVREGGPEHEAGGIDHRELVDELHRVLEGGVEGEGAGADEQVAHEGDEEDAVVVVLVAGVHAFEGEVDEEEVGEGVDDFGGVGGCIVILFV